MGRMADARKRAKRAGEGGPRRASRSPPRPRPARREGRPPRSWSSTTSRRRPPSRPRARRPPASASAAPAAASARPATSPGRIELPASGLAEDILAQHEASLVPEADAAAKEPAPAPAAVPDVAPTAGHSLSFFAAPVQEQRAAAEATEHLVTFYLDREEYGVDVRRVQEIRRVGEITTVPRAPEFVRGVINLRGRILPVLDMKKKLGLGEVAESRAARIVVVRVRERLLGLLVDGASQVPKIPVSRIEPPPEEVVERGGDYIRGVAKLDDRLIILVDLERLLAHELRAGASARSSAGPESA